MKAPVPFQLASLHIGTRPLSVDANVAITAGGLLAIAALVGSILLTTAVLVQAAKK